MRLRGRFQALKETLEREFNPGPDGDPEQITRLQSGLGITGVDGYTEITPPRGIPLVVGELETTDEDKEEK